MRGALAILRGELRSTLRRPVQGLLMLFLVLLPAALGRLERQRPADPAPHDPCALLPPVQLQGSPPSWLAWPGRRADTPEAALASLRFEGDQVHLEGPGGGQPPQVVIDCLEQQIVAERSVRLGRLGLSGVRVEVVEPTPQPGPDAPLWPRALAAGAFLGWLWVGESLGGRRRQGVLEAWLTTRATARDVVIASWALGVLIGCVGFVLMALVGGRWDVWVHAPAGLAVHVALAVRVFAGSPASASTLRPLLGIAPLELSLVLLAGWLAPLAPWLAALVPLGGSIVAVGGSLSGGAALLADVAAIGWSGLALASASVALRGSELVPSSLGATSARRARGRWWPELGVSGLLAVAGAALPWLEVRHPVGWWIPMVVLPLLLWILPVSLAPKILGLPPASILPAPRPAWGAIARAVLVGIGAGGLWLLAPSIGILTEGDAGLSEALGPQLAALPLLAVLLGLSATAIGEELLFRGLIQWLLSRGPWRGCVGQALLYGLAPLSPLLWASGLGVGLLLGALRVASGSLVPCLVAAIVGRWTLAAGAGLSEGWPAPPVAAGLVALGLIGLGLELQAWIAGRRSDQGAATSS